MTRSEFWTQLELNPDMIAYETRDYVVVVTPRAWREQARSETDRNLQEFCIVNKTFYTLEGSSNNLMIAAQVALQLQDGVDEYINKEPPIGTVIRFPSKDRPE